MKSLLILYILLVSAVGFSQTKYYKGKDGKIRNQAQFDKIESAIKLKKANAADDVVIKDHLLLFSRTISKWISSRKTKRKRKVKPCVRA
jgi:hypothetical protein